MAIVRMYGDRASAPATPVTGGEAATINVLVAEDDEDMRELVADALRGEGLQIAEAVDGRALLDRLLTWARRGWQKSGFDLIVSDLYMPYFSGLAMLELVRGARLNTPVILMTGFADSATRHTVNRYGGWLLEKPFALDRLCSLAGSLVRDGRSAPA